MANEKMCFKNYVTCVDNNTNSKTRKKLNKKSHKGRYYGGVESGQSGTASVSESLLTELLGGAIPGTVTQNILSHTPNEKEEEQEQEQRGNKIDMARRLFQALINQPNTTRKDIINKFIEDVGVTPSTAVSYYERLAKEAGITGKDDKEDLGAGITGKDDKEDLGAGMTSDNEFNQQSADELPADTELDLGDEIEDSGDPQRAGVIRTVDNAHLIYKRKNEEGTFEELWIYSIGSRVNDELDIRRDILAGTDIPPKKTKSPNGTQSYTLSSMGNAQYLHVSGLTN